jgi:AcrR family transcriptional regulator
MGGGQVFGAERSHSEGGDESEIATAMLLVVGEKGYVSATVRDAVERSGVSRSTFYRHFANKEDCFGRAYEIAARRLCDCILAAAAEETGWPAQFRAGLEVLLRYVDAYPLSARALLVGPHEAGGAATTAYEKAVRRLTLAIDRARSPIDTHAPPPLTARFVAATVEFTVREWLIDDKGGTCISRLPELVHVAMLFYFGLEAAQEAIEGI